MTYAILKVSLGLTQEHIVVSKRNYIVRNPQHDSSKDKIRVKISMDGAVLWTCLGGMLVGLPALVVFL